jgi:hypothetical protein
MNLILSILFSALFIQQPQVSTLINNDLTLVAEHKVARSGQEVCVNISVADFNKLLSMQYSLVWDPEVLAFENVQGFNLPYLGENNFGLNRKDKGILTFVWIDNALKGISLADGTVIYQICFKVKGQIGSGSEIKFSQQPTPFEVVDKSEQVLGLNGVAGSVVVN